MRLLPFLLVFFASCQPLCWAQIELKQTKVQVVSGLSNPQVVGDAVIISGDSKPVISPAVMIDATPADKATSLAALQIPTFEPGVVNKVGDNRWLLVGTGSYLVIASGPSELKHLKVELGPTPAPPEPVDPVPTPDDLSPVAKDSRAAMQVFVQSMAGNFNRLASETRQAKFKTVMDASTAANSLDVLSRNQFKAAMAKVMQPKIGSGDLPADAAQTFEQIAIGFKGVK